MQNIITTVIASLKADPAMRGQQGEKGDTGADGVVDYDRVREIVRDEVAMIPPAEPIYMRRVNGRTGKVISVDAIHPGEGWTFLEYPGQEVKDAQ